MRSTLYVLRSTKIQKIARSLILLAIIFFAQTASAAGSGFVPATGLWFSKTTVIPGEPVFIYTVVVNTEYTALAGTVGFYDNTELIDKVAVNALPKDQARELKAAWLPTAGAHTISARFIEVYSVESGGQHLPVDTASITVTAGAPLLINNLPVVPETTIRETAVPSSSVNSPAQNNVVALGATNIVVVKTGSVVTLAPASSPKTAGTDSTQVSTTVAVQPGNSFSGALSSLDELFQKNREALDNAQKIGGTITSTAGKISAVYGQTQAALIKGQSYYNQGQQEWQKIAPYLEKVKPYWLGLSNNNEPKRLLIIAGVILALYLLLKFRRARYRQFYDR